MHIARRLVVYEAVGAVMVAAATVPFSKPWAGTPPLWVQLLGLTFLLASIGANLLVLHRIRNAVTLVRLNDVLRLRIAIVLYSTAAFVLFPLPPSWGWFWFALTILGATLGLVQTIRLITSAYQRKRRIG
ncbi:hypothetical protein FZI91_22900 [Mycobacterium sp. CBMA271]|uniref:hypothetical protein n=1 Tax=unclassified Mycobacteroides TaxID=2618759 RepID=UPI0012DF7CBA|nr:MULTISPECIES: hypothetical protein [unclassified Mycobacteroides]MUM15918.1 hypothetical protein [Mycobacteroides sp. CBMA 326]MUM24529.1 hypothetical protein [Mycobacteroides sp. CBMA 271]